jgi:hypothetical protein
LWKKIVKVFIFILLIYFLRMNVKTKVVQLRRFSGRSYGNRGKLRSAKRVKIPCAVKFSFNALMCPPTQRAQLLTSSENAHSCCSQGQTWPIILLIATLKSSFSYALEEPKLSFSLGWS